MVVNDIAWELDERGALESIASRLAPTVSAWAWPPVGAGLPAMVVNDNACAQDKHRRSRQDIVATLLQATAIDGVIGSDALLARRIILPARLALSGSPHHRAGRRRTARLVLAIVLPGVVVDLVIDVFMLAAPHLCRGRTGHGGGCGALCPSTGWHGALYRMLCVGLGLAGTSVLCDGLGSLSFEGDHCHCQGAGAQQQHQHRQGMGQYFHDGVSRQASARLTVC